MVWPFPGSRRVRELRRHPRHRCPFRPRVARLEPRLVLSLNIQFDYAFDVNHFFDSQAKKDLLQAAANTIAGTLGNTLSAITPAGGNVWTPEFFNPSNPSQNLTLNNPSIPANTIIIYVGGSVLGGSEAGFGGYGGYSSASGSSAWITQVSTRGESGSPAPFAPWGGSVSFDDSPGTNWYFGADPAGIQSSQVDFFTVAEHEIGHILGIGTSPQWASQVSNGFFDGPAAEAAHGGLPVPVDAGAGHFAEGTTSGGQFAVMTPILNDGIRISFTPLDFAALQDLGWQVRVRPPSTTLAGPSTYTPVRGQVMTFYALVHPSSPSAGAPTGTVSFLSGSTVLATQPLVTANGQTFAAMPTAPMGTGTYTITTVYNGDANNSPSTGSMTFTVVAGATTTVAGPSDFAPVRGEPLAINAIVSVNAPGSGAPTGTVTFKSGATVLATEPVVSANGISFARLPAVPYGVGNYAITAVYNGDAGGAPSLGTTTFTVGPDATTTIAGPSNFAPFAGQSLVVNAIVSPRAPGAGTPSGTVTFRYGAASWVEPLRTINGQTYASLPLAPLGPGTYAFTAVYNGDSGDLPSSGSTTFTVTTGSSVASAFLAAPPMTSPWAPAPASSAPAVGPRLIPLARSQIVPTGDPAWLAALDALEAERSSASVG